MRRTMRTKICWTNLINRVIGNKFNLFSFYFIKVVSLYFFDMLQFWSALWQYLLPEMVQPVWHCYWFKKHKIAFLKVYCYYRSWKLSLNSLLLILVGTKMKTKNTGSGLQTGEEGGIKMV
jgi:hypothetical protein